MKTIYGFALMLSVSLVACNNSDKGSNEGDDTSKAGVQETAPNIAYTIKSTVPHDTSYFTEGLELYKGRMLESTGLNGQSRLVRYDPATGKVEKSVSLESQYFGEGITVLHDTVYQLTYREGKVFMYRASDLSKIGELSLQGEGWGMTNNGRELIVTNGSSNIYYYQPGTFKLLRTVEVSDHGTPAVNLNELEYIDGKLYANQWQYNDILQIDPLSGKVLGKLDFGPTSAQLHAADPHAEYMNGLAWDASQKLLYVTGKNWANTYLVQLP